MSSTSAGLFLDHHPLHERPDRADGRAGHLRERRPLVAENARIAVGVGADRVPQAQVADDPREDSHRVLGAGVLGIGRDPVEVPLGLRPLDLELGNERQPLPTAAERHHHRSLGREEVEAREVLDVRLVEEDDPAQAARARVLEEPAPALRELVPRDAGCLHVQDTIRARGSGPALNGGHRCVHHLGTMAQVGLDRAAATAGGLLERDDELTALGDRLAEVEASARGHVVLLRGEAGVGKTALIREFCELHEGSARIVGGACEPLFAPRPLGPFLEIAQQLEGDLPSLVEQGAMPYQVVAELAEELRRKTPTVLLLEDVHWADEATLDVFRLLARRVESVPALVVASYRDDELDVADPLRIVLGELATSPSISRMKLSGLSPAAVAELAEPYGADADELFAKTAGNPFFVAEALAAGADAIPETVRDAVLARTARLGSFRAIRPGGGRDRAAAGGALAPRGACRGERGRARRMPRLRNAPVRPRRDRVPARARAPRGRGLDRAAAQAGAAPGRPGGPRRAAGRPPRPRPARAPRGSGRGRGGRAPLCSRCRPSGRRPWALTARPPPSTPAPSGSEQISRRPSVPTCSI